MNWKLYGWCPTNINYKKFYYSDFSHIKELKNFFGYDFFYMENYHYNDSKTGSCYEMWDCVIKPGDIVVDLGANAGFFTRKASEIASKVISIEGSPEIFSCLVENTHDLDNVECLNAIAVGDISYTGNCYSDGSKIKITLDKIMDLYQIDRIDFLKCDIEGGEWDIFRNLSPDTLKKIDRIAMEAHGVPDFDFNDFYLPGKIRHSFYSNGLVNFYFVP